MFCEAFSGGPSILTFVHQLEDGQFNSSHLLAFPPLYSGKSVEFSEMLQIYYTFSPRNAQEFSYALFSEYNTCAEGLLNFLVIHIDTYGGFKKHAGFKET